MSDNVADHGSPTTESVTLARFVTGESNRLVRHTLHELHARQTRFNPVVFVGPSGFGKSLLLRATCDLNAKSTTVYTTAADFARDFASALDLENIDEFRQRFLGVDLLAIDDIQHIRTKQPAQIELCSLLDQLVDEHKQIVVSASQTIEKCEDLLPQLTSRLSAGLSVPIAAPSKTDCVEILQLLLRRYDVNLDTDVITYLADLATTQTKSAPAPYMNHLVAQLTAQSEATGTPINLSFARDLFASEANAQPSLQTIANVVAKRFNLQSRELRSASRKQMIVRARGVAMVLARSLTDKSLDEVGKYFGNRDHTTVLHACRRTNQLLEENRDLELLCRELRDSIG